jgi:hypothetical protein
LAVFKEDIHRYNLLPLRVKTTDPRAAKYRQRHGDVIVELDSLSPTVLRQRIEEAICQYIDWPRWERCKMVEQVERQSILEFVNEWRQRQAV